MIQHITRPFREFFKLEASSGIMLLFAAVLALIISNGSYSDEYFSILKKYITLGTESFGLKLSVLHWINDVLMTVFFFLVSLEIKREMVQGELSNPKQALLPIIGAVGGTVHWVFIRDNIISVTVSAADDLVDKSSSLLAKILWYDVVQILGLQNSATPVNRIIKEKHATFSQSPEQISLRPKAQTVWDNLFLAGDWTETNLPATIEGAVRSGRLVSEIMN